MAVKVEQGEIGGALPLAWAFAQAPKMDGSACGDGCLLTRRGAQIIVAVADGVGSGRDAAAAASACLSGIAERPAGVLPEFFDQGHARLTGTRGAALAVAVIDTGAGTVEWAALGDIDGVIHDVRDAAAPAPTIMQRGGTLGHVHPGILAKREAFGPGQMLVLTTDGISRRYRGLHPARMPPAEFAETCLARFGRGGDDRTVLAVSVLEGTP